MQRVLVMGQEWPMHTQHYHKLKKEIELLPKGSSSALRSKLEARIRRAHWALRISEQERAELELMLKRARYSG